MVRIDSADLVEANMDIGSSFKEYVHRELFCRVRRQADKGKRAERPPSSRCSEKSSAGLNHVEFTCSDILYYQLQMLDHLGFMPNFSTCVQCGKHLAEHELTSFSNERGGVVCPVLLQVCPPQDIPRGPHPQAGRPARTRVASIRAFSSGTEERCWRLSSLSI